MALPNNVERVNLKFGPYWDGQGNPVKATLTARRSVALTHLATGGIVLPMPESAGTDGAVEGSLLVVATDATGVTPQNPTYDLTIAFDSSTGIAPIVRRGVALPKGAPTVDVDLLVQGTPSNGEAAWGPAVLSVNGQTGIVTIQAGTGDGGSGGGVSLPTGGTAGQILRKNSVLEGDALWANPEVTAVQITDATATGRSVLKAATQAAALSAIGAAAVSHSHTSTQVTDFASAVDARIAIRVGAAPATLDTLDELANALGDDANFAVTISNRIALKADSANPNFTGIPKINSVPIPTNIVGSDSPVTIITDPAVDPKTLAADEIAILDSDDVLTKPATVTARSAVVVNTDRTQALVPLSELGSGGGAGSGGRAATAKRVLASAAGIDPQRVLQVHPDPPAVTITNSSTSTITGAVRIGLKRTAVGSATFDVAGDPHWEYPGARPGKLSAYSNRVDTAIADYLTGGTSQARRDYYRLRTELNDNVIEFSFQVTTATMSYRIWVDGYPLATDMTNATVTAGSNQLIKLTFPATDFGPHIVELEVNDPRQGGAFISPTGSVARWRTPRPLVVGFGDSHTAGANGVRVSDTWLQWATRLLGCDWANMGIGGSGFLVTTGGGTVAPNFRSRITPDVSVMDGDVIVFFGGYNDIGVASSAAIQAEAQLCYQQLATENPDAVVIAVGPLWQNHNITAAARLQDDAQRTAAEAVGIPYISLFDPSDQYGSTTAWAASTAYQVGDQVAQANTVWKSISAHTSGTSFTTDQPTRWRAISFLTGTGREGTTAGNGNADVLLSTDGIHLNYRGHKQLGYFLASEISKALQAVAAA